MNKKSDGPDEGSQDQKQAETPVPGHSPKRSRLVGMRMPFDLPLCGGCGLVLTPLQALEYIFFLMCRYPGVEPGVITGKEKGDPLKRGAIIPFQKKKGQKKASMLRFRRYAFLHGECGTKLISFGRHEGGSGLSHIIAVPWEGIYHENAYCAYDRINALTGKYRKRILLSADDEAISMPKDSGYRNQFGEMVDKWVSVEGLLDPLLDTDVQKAQPFFYSSSCDELVSLILTS